MNLELLEKQISKLTKDIDGSLYETLLNYNIHLTVVDCLNCKVYGFVYYSRAGYYHLIINGKLNIFTQRKTLIHEIKHIIYDMPKIGYMVGVDMIRTPLEIEADRVAETLSLYG